MGSTLSAGDSPLSVYVHIPWCRVRCGYCDFNTYVTDTSDPAATTPYIDALVAEIGQAGRVVASTGSNPVGGHPAQDPGLAAGVDAATSRSMTGVGPYGRGDVRAEIGRVGRAGRSMTCPGTVSDSGGSFVLCHPARNEMESQDSGVLAGVDAATSRSMTGVGVVQPSHGGVTETGERRRVGTVYFGGGTPTLMSPGDYGRVLRALREQFDIDDDAEITTEANPETLTPSLLAKLRELGINRLSMGMQSAVPQVLATLDRIHTPGQVVRCATWARAAGFDNISLDLIYGTPGESMADWEESVAAALALEPDHISAYSLIVEPATPLARRMAHGELAYPSDDDLADKYLRADQLFTAAGLTWYEVSNWARPGYECRHNLAYWRSQPWWGIGAGAHSYANSTRWWNQRRPATYIAALGRGESPRAGSEVLTDQQRHLEAVMLGLRLAEGLDERVLSPTEVERAQTYLRSGHLVRQGNHLVCTLSGRLIADGIVREILD